MHLCSIRSLTVFEMIKFIVFYFKLLLIFGLLFCLNEVLLLERMEFICYYIVEKLYLAVCMVRLLEIDLYMVGCLIGYLANGRVNLANLENILYAFIIILKLVYFGFIKINSANSNTKIFIFLTLFYSTKLNHLCASLMSCSFPLKGVNNAIQEFQKKKLFEL